MKNGVLTEKADVLGDEPMEDKVYTKKLKIDEKLTDYHNVEYISISSNDKDFKNVTPSDIRINIFWTKLNNWNNIFITEASDHFIEVITNKLFKK